MISHFSWDYLFSHLPSFSITALFIPMTSKCFILHSSVFVVYNHLAFFITTCYCFIICFHVYFYLVAALTIIYLEISFTLPCYLLLVKPTGAFTSQDSCNCNSSVEVIFHEMLFFQALSRDHLPVKWIGLFFDSISHSLYPPAHSSSYWPSQFWQVYQSVCSLAGGTFLLSITLQVEPGKHTYPFYSGCQLASIIGSEDLMEQTLTNQGGSQKINTNIPLSQATNPEAFLIWFWWSSSPAQLGTSSDIPLDWLSGE